MGGETVHLSRSVRLTGGLSPRGRGNLRYHRPHVTPHRSIPAWAGKPALAAGLRARRPVYPRVGGETGAGADPGAAFAGLSPRGRGNPLRQNRYRRPSRSIPAWAGKPRRPSNSTPSRTVYPRVGGETYPDILQPTGKEGLSPRGRGNRGCSVTRPQPKRSIPAWAGKPSTTRRWPTICRVYPRVGGETAWLMSRPLTTRGLSPRGRGNLHQIAQVSPDERSIPAWAGKPRVAPGEHAGGRVYPRVGGETAKTLPKSTRCGGLSPRGRGNPRSPAPALPRPRSIPAWAGKPPAGRSGGGRNRVYPRVGGETFSALARSERNCGLSPRGRGNRADRDEPRPGLRSIPAWAGKPSDL